MADEELRKIFAKRLRHYLELNGYNQADLARYMHVTTATTAKWCTGQTMPRIDKVQSICNWLGINKSDLLENNPDRSNVLRTDVPFGRYRIPILTTVAAGKPMYAEEDVLEWIDYDKDPGDHVRACRIEGSSMIPRIQDGDTVIFDTDLGWEDGDVIIATVNGDHATCKRIKRYEDGLALLSDNASIAPMYYSRQEIEELPVKIVGRVTEVRGKL
ncbi:LexA family protein [Bilifractor porci]|jgi:repressor LexA|uniref:LexA family transcriptional regulator n=1 Tax=Bilifractor porci TaxID=2606636 RepID=A0A7X2TP22_9FIRM|nr:XRE family transcriptional regulator [Bilifractor porci]MST82852.1 LexA family transcriptional regulator [Bilifractor porci]